ncbi:hypothetical protein AB6A40_005187 [Gnathostoma spinigerum]|uniref:Uncharacterized protein n=1 Tax=Gnathostoma spinigerum TaxID=75299 RepID=A0ABD6ENC7_9BILA
MFSEEKLPVFSLWFFSEYLFYPSITPAEFLLCDEGVQTWLPHFLCDTSNDCKDITLPDRAVLSIEESHIDLLRTIRLHLSEGDVTQLDLDALLTRAVLEHNTVGVLLILHIISGKIEPNILRLAVMTDDCLSLKALLHKFIPPTSEDMALLGSLLHSALIHSKFSTVRELLKFRSSCANILLGNGDSLLQVAIKLGLVEGVQTLLEYGSNPKLVNSLGETSLHTLCTYAIENRLEIARTILAKGHCDEITLNKANKNGKSPLEVACAEGLWEIALYDLFISICICRNI